MRSRDVLWALSFLWLAVFMYLGAEWLVWGFLVPFIMLSVRCSLRSIFVAGSIVVLLIGYLWLEWLKLYNTQIMIIGLASFYLFFMFFAFLIRLLCKAEGLHFRNYFKVLTGDNELEQKRLRSATLVLIPPTIWFCTAKMLSYTLIGSSWTDLAMFQSAMAPLIWVIGAKGVTCIIILFNSIIANWLQERSRDIAIAGMLLLMIIGGCIAYSSFASIGEKSVKISLLQGNFPQTWKWRQEQAEKVIIDTYLNMTKEIKEAKPDIIAWPEYAIADDIFLKRHLLEKITTVAKDVGSYLVLGALTRLEGTVNGEPRRSNLAVIISPQPENIPHNKYVSVKPIPFEKWIIPGPRIHTIVTEKAKLGILLCFEETIPEIAAKMSQQGAELFLSLANNSRFKQTKGVYLASLQTKLRAAENGKYVVRASNTGITQVVNPCGRLIAKAMPFSREILTTEVRLSNWMTPYSRYGDRPMMMILFAVWCYIWASKYKLHIAAKNAKGH